MTMIKFNHKGFTKFILRVFLASLMACSLAVASGGGGSGGSGGGDTNQQAQVNYDKGKKLFYERVVCESCLYAGLELETAAVRVVWSDLKKDLKKNGSIGQELTRGQRKAVKRFVKKRFSL
jgi:hypothetical protein